MNHVYGSDAMIYHGQDFNTDVTFSLQDIWVLNDVDLQKVKRWCVDKDTLISFVDGTEIKIKDVVKNKINKPVWGYKNGKIVKSKILDWQEIQNKDVYEIKTDKRKILITGDNEVWVQSIMSRASALPPYINEPEWRRADCIIVGDMIYSIHNEPSNKEQDNKNTPTITNRMGIFSWFNRWGGNCNDNEGYEEKSKDGHTAYNTSINTDNEHRRENDRLDKKKAWGENEQQNKIYSKQIQDKYGKIYKIYENLLLCFNLGIQLLTHIGRSRALSDYKEGKGNINNKIYKISSGTTEEEVQSKIYKRGNRYMGEGAHIEPGNRCGN